MPDPTNPITALEDVILTRRSIGKVDETPVPVDLIRRLISLAVHAPNHKRTIPWRFVVIRGDARLRIGGAHADAYVRTHPDATTTDRDREERRLERAPVVIAVISRPGDADPVVRTEDRDAVSAGIQNMLLGAHAHGLGAIWRTGAFVVEEEIRAVLELEPNDEIVGFVYLGAPDAPPTPRTVPDPETLTTWLDA